MGNDLVQIEFYFPKSNSNNKAEIVDQIIFSMEEKGSIDYSGYADLELLRQGLLDHIGDGNISNYQSISEDKQKEIEDVILNTIERCNEKLPVPTKNFIFVHPYFPTKEDEVFGGVMAVAVYSCVFHLFINLEQATRESIENTVAHELNHTIYYYHHYDDFNNYTLLDAILLEGLAENFREQYLKPEITKWAGALKEEEALQVITKLDDNLLNTTSQKTIRGFLFGNKEYKRWTGYSTGYWLVKKFIEKNSDLSWEDLMKLERTRFLEVLS